MIFVRRCVLVLLVGLIPTLHAASAKKQPTRPIESTAAYKGAIVTDAATGNVLFEDRSDVVTPPASMTKLMTFAVLHDRLASGAISLSTPVKISPDDSGMAGTQVYLDPRETFPVEELIYAMMVHSANDAAHALARFAGDSVPAFIELMNAKAKALGMTNTTFRTPHGLPPNNRNVNEGDLTTPRDYAVLSRYLLQKTDVLKYTVVRDRPFGANRPKGAFKMENHNKLLGKVAGVDGLKTGFTDSAGYCLSATALRNGRRVIVVIMGSLGPNGARDYGRARDVKTIELLEKGFAALPPAPAPAPTATPTPTLTPTSNALITPAPQPSSARPTPPPEQPPLKLTIPKK